MKSAPLLSLLLAIPIGLADASLAAQRPAPAAARSVLKPSEAGRVEVRSISYRAEDGTSLPADVYFNPAIRGSRPAIVFVSGTSDARGWGVYRDYGRLAAEQGFVGIVPAKRFGRDAAEIAHGISDTKALVDQLSKLVPDLVNQERVCLWAFSAGGTTLSIAFDAASPKLSCVVAYYPVLLLPEVGAEPQPNVLAESPVDAVAQNGASVSPPTLIVRAGKDSEAINKGIAAFAQAALNRNVPLTLINLPSAQHAFDLLDDTDWSRSAISQSFEFVAHFTSRKQSAPSPQEMIPRTRTMRRSRR